MKRCITLVFDHPPCESVRVDVRLPLPDPITEGADAMADRIRPACPNCNAHMRYVGFHFEDHEIEINRPLPDPAGSP